MELQSKCAGYLYLKCSPRLFVFLWSLLSVPSRRILQCLLNFVQCRMGIDVHVFSILKDTVQTRFDKDHVCCLMFDEMSIQGDFTIQSED